MRTMLLAAALLAGCTGSALTPAQRQARLQDVPEPAQHPRGIVAAYPPADVSSTPLRCWPNGEETVCGRTP